MINAKKIHIIIIYSTICSILIKIKLAWILGKKSHVYNNNNKFLYIINENKMILINTNLSDET